MNGFEIVLAVVSIVALVLVSDAVLSEIKRDWGENG